MKLDRVKIVANRVLPWAVPLVALMMLVLMLTPSGIWRRPVNDVIHRGFDSNLIHVDKKGSAAAEGLVIVAPDFLELTALPRSNPTVHLISSEEDYQVAMNLRVLENRPSTIPLQIKVWSPRFHTAYTLNFGSDPSNLLTVIRSKGNTVLKRTDLGTYLPGLWYHLTISLDRQTGVLRGRLESREALILESNTLVLRGGGGPGQPDYQEVRSVPEDVPVDRGQRYVFGGTIKLISGGGWYKLVIDWLDNEKRKIGTSNDWQSPKELDSWTQREFDARAPENAAFARMNLGAGPATSYYMTNLFLKDASKLETNLLMNGDLRGGFVRWELVGPGVDNNENPTIYGPSFQSVEFMLTADEEPKLFLKLPVALSISASSIGGLAGAVVEDYSLAIPQQRWKGLKVADARATGLVVALTIIGFVVIMVTIIEWTRKKISLGEASLLRAHAKRSLTISQWPLLVALGGSVLVLVVLSALAFNLGYHPYDFLGSGVWSYVGAQYGLTEIYSLPSTVTPATVWRGEVPYAPVIFPYGAVMAYVFYGIGWVDRLFLAAPSSLTLAGFHLGFVTKSVILLFTLADGLLIYLALTRLKASRRWSLLGVGLFLFNPAVWFVSFIWGTTHSISIFFLLTSVWLAVRGNPRLAWVALSLTALTRPQLLVPAFLLGLMFMRKFSIRENVYGLSISVVVAFVVLAPFMLRFTPSFAVSLILGQVSTQNPSDPELGAFFPASLGALNLWPLISRFTEGLQGKPRFGVPSTEPLIGSFTYSDVGTVLVFIAVVVIAAYLLIGRGSFWSDSRRLHLVAIGLLVLLLLKTGIATHHLVLILPLVILARSTLANIPYLSMIGILTITTLISVYGDFGFGTSLVGESLMPALYYQNNPVTHFFMKLYRADLFITLGSLANLLVLAWLAAETMRLPLLSWWGRRQAFATAAIGAVANLVALGLLAVEAVRLSLRSRWRRLQAVATPATGAAVTHEPEANPQAGDHS